MGNNWTTTPISTPLITGVYGTSLTDLGAEMGETNRDIAADPNNTGDASSIGTHETAALAFADTYINSRLQAAGYAYPAVVGNLAMLKLVETKLAAYQLYQIRGMNDGSPDAKHYANAFSDKREWAENQLENLLWMNAGGFARPSGYTDAPVGVSANVNAQGQRILSPSYPRPYWDFPFWRWG